MKFFKYVWLTLLMVPIVLNSQTVTNQPTPAIGPSGSGSPVVANRLGDNMGGTDFFGSGEFLKVMPCVMNCGAEPVLAQVILTLTAAGTTTTFAGTNQYDMGNGQTGGNQDGFNLWAGATVTVVESLNSEMGSGNKGFTTTILGNQGSIQATTCSFTGSGPYTITCNTDNNPTTAGFTTGQIINWETLTSGSGSYTNGYQCCTITALTSSSISWTQTATPTGTATGGFLGNNVAKVYTTTTAAPYAFAVGDVIVLKLLQSPTPTAVLYASSTSLGIFGAGLAVKHSGGGVIFAATTGGGYTLCATCGSQSIGATVSNLGDTAGYGVVLDDATANAGTDRFTNLNGTYQIGFEAHCATACNGATVTDTVQRTGQSACTLTVTPTTTPTNYTGSCTFAETASTSSFPNATLTENLLASYGTGAATILLDNLDFHKTSGLDSTNTSVYTDGFIQKLRDHCAVTVSGARCTIRNWTSQNEETAASWTASYYTAPQAGISPAQGKGSLRLFDYLNAVALLGNADPYIELPVTMTAADAVTIQQFIIGSSSTTGGAIRAALGQSAPYSFSHVYMTLCNECWNGADAYQNLGGTSAVSCSIPSPNAEIYYYLSLVLRDVYAAMRADSSYNGTVEQLGFPAQTANTASIPCALARSKPDFVELNNYKYLSVANAVGDANIWGAAFAEPWVNTHNAASASKFYQANALVKSTSPCGASGTAQCYVTVYETNVSTQGTCGGSEPACNAAGPSNPPQAILQGAEDSITAGLGQSIIEPLSADLNCQYLNVCVENLFAAVEFSNTGPGSTTAKMWGDTIDHGGAMSYANSIPYAPRPVELGTQVRNRAVVGPMVYCPLTTQPTYNWPGDPYNGFPDSSYSSANGTPAQANTPYLYAFCFNNGNKYGIVYYNTNSINYTVNYSGAYAPAGTVSIAQVNASSPSTICEAATGSTTNTATACALSTSSSSGLSSLTVPPGITSIVYSLGTSSTAIHAAGSFTKTGSGKLN